VQLLEQQVMEQKKQELLKTSNENRQKMLDAYKSEVPNADPAKWRELENAVDGLFPNKPESYGNLENAINQQMAVVGVIDMHNNTKKEVIKLREQLKMFEQHSKPNTSAILNGIQNTPIHTANDIQKNNVQQTPIVNFNRMNQSYYSYLDNRFEDNQAQKKQKVETTTPQFNAPQPHPQSNKIFYNEHAQFESNNMATKWQGITPLEFKHHK